MNEIEKSTEEQMKQFLDYWESKKVKLPNPDNYPKSFKYYWDIYWVMYHGKNQVVPVNKE